MLAWFRCLLRAQHNPVRHPLGGFRCVDCAYVGADLEEMGFAGGGYVLPIRRLFSRDHREYTRTMAWEPSRRGW